MWLQWVHGPITVVTATVTYRERRFWELQWVHGPITVVTGQTPGTFPGDLFASMGPRSDNRGYVRKVVFTEEMFKASMGPRSDNRGYACASASGRKAGGT